MNTQIISKLLCLMAFFYSCNALADVDAKSIPGAICQTTGSSYDELNIMRLRNGTMLNRSDKRQTWTCPMIRDTMAMAGNLDGIYVRAFTRMASSAYQDKVRCGIYSRTESNKYYTALHLNLYRDRGNGGTWEIGVSKRMNTPAYGPIYVRCTVPGKRIRDGKTFYSGISQFMMNER